jgi:NAD-dependent dihydropyrimidine dehydrogenase PreA subunit
MAVGHLPSGRETVLRPGRRDHERLGSPHNLEGLYAAGDQLFASNCHGHAAATGHYAGRHAARDARAAPEPRVEPAQVEEERAGALAPLGRPPGVTWKHLALRVTEVMKACCGEKKTEPQLEKGLARLDEFWREEAAKVSAANPHELMRCLESLSVLTNAGAVLNACRARKASSKQLHFFRTNYPEMDPPEWHKFVTVCRTERGVEAGERSTTTARSRTTTRPPTPTTWSTCGRSGWLKGDRRDQASRQPSASCHPGGARAGGVFPVVIVGELCIGCNRCVEACQVDVFLPSTTKGAPPVVHYPGECWHSGDCVAVCPVPGAIRWNVMPKNRVHWRRKATGEEFHL